MSGTSSADRWSIVIVTSCLIVVAGCMTWWLVLSSPKQSYLPFTTGSHSDDCSCERKSSVTPSTHDPRLITSFLSLFQGEHGNDYFELDARTSSSFVATGLPHPLADVRVDCVAIAQSRLLADALLICRVKGIARPVFYSARKPQTALLVRDAAAVTEIPLADIEPFDDGKIVRITGGLLKGHFLPLPSSLYYDSSLTTGHLLCISNNGATIRSISSSCKCGTIDVDQILAEFGSVVPFRFSAPPTRNSAMQIDVVSEAGDEVRQNLSWSASRTSPFQVRVRDKVINIGDVSDLSGRELWSATVDVGKMACVRIVSVGPGIKINRVYRYAEGQAEIEFNVSPISFATTIRDGVAVSAISVGSYYSKDAVSKIEVTGTLSPELRASPPTVLFDDSVGVAQRVVDRRVFLSGKGKIGKPSVIVPGGVPINAVINGEELVVSLVRTEDVRSFDTVVSVTVDGNTIGIPVHYYAREKSILPIPEGGK